MKWFTRIASVGAGAALSAALLTAPVAAQPASFKSLEGIALQELSLEEMQAISGELNAYDIAAALFALAAKYANYPRLAASLKASAERTLANAVQLNAAFAKLGILTPCTSSLCPK